MPKLERLWFDIETVADYDAVLTLPDPKPHGGIKDPVKIEADIEKKRVKQIEKAALDPHTGRICALGWATRPTNEPEAFIARVDDEVSDALEKELLTRFWDLLHYTEGRNVGWNSTRFDLPYIMIRSFALQVPRPKTLASLAKYSSEPSTDLMGIISNWSWDGVKSLKWAAQRYGWPVATPEIDGSMIEQINDAQLADYVKSDVGIVQGAYLDMHGYFFSHE
ncbi:hypothetical protein LCGC14_1087350 [marine sediment metagenome]|uniref:Predicted 3'-5' exonuclease PolB-like domain-containing protein n=1 Tax=marine sediment metagenome TaxID=412755 RepID=A0A0F9MDL8_9ZZZZ